MIKGNLSNDARYAFAIGLVRAKEAKLLDKGRYDRLLEAKSKEDFLSLLSDTPYAIFQEEDPDKLFEKARIENLSFFYRYCLDEWVLDIFRLREDFYNLKLIIKAKFSKIDPSPLLSPLGKYPLEVWKGVLRDEVKGLPDIFRKTITRAIQSYYEEKDPIYLDIYADKAMVESLSLSSQHNGFLRGYFSIYSDLENLRTFLRIKFLQEDTSLFSSAFISSGTLSFSIFKEAFTEDLKGVIHRFGNTPYRELLERGILYLLDNNSFILLERLIHEYLLEYLKSSRYLTFGFEPLVAYLLFKETEIQNLQKIWIGISQKLPRDRIKEMVVYAS